MVKINRRKLITGLISFAAAPAIVRASSLMPVKVMDSFDPKMAWDRIIEYVEPLDYNFYDSIQWSLHQIDKITGIRTITPISSKDFNIEDNGMVIFK